MAKRARSALPVSRLLGYLVVHWLAVVVSGIVLAGAWLGSNGSVIVVSALCLLLGLGGLVHTGVVLILRVVRETREAR